MENKVSIIVPIYNSENDLKRCLESLINQTYTNIEIILINDGSTDNSEKICKEYKQKDKRIVYKYQKNSGVSSARNKGLNIATGEYILFIDSDDYISIDYIENVYNKMKTSKCEIAVTGLTEVTSTGETIKQVMYIPQDKIMQFNDFIDDYINYAYFTCVKMLFKKTLAEKLKFISELKYGEDMFFAYSLFKKSKILYVSNADYYYVQNSSSATHQIELDSLKKYMEDNIYIFEKILKEYPDKKDVINNRLLTKLNIAASRYMSNKKISKLELKKFIKIYRKKIDGAKIMNINYIGRFGKLKLVFIKYNMLNLYIIVSRIKYHLNKGE